MSAAAIGLALLLATPARAAGPAESADAAPVEGPSLPSVDDEPGADPLPDIAEPEPEPPAEPATTNTTTTTVEPPPPTMQAPTVLRVAVGLSSELDGNKAEKALLDELEAGVMASSSPRADVRRLKVGAAEAAEICREGLDDLVINVGYMPERDEPVLMTRDCRLDVDLGMRSSAAAGDPALLGVLWAEHDDRVANGARERRRARVSPKVRNGLIAGAAVIVIGVAVGLLIAGAVRRDSVVLVLTPKQ